MDDQDNLQVSKSGDTMSGELSMGANKITSLETPTDDSDASTKKYVHDSHKVDVIDTTYVAASRVVPYAVNTPLVSARHLKIETSTLISPKKIIKLNLEHFARYDSFPTHGFGLAILGRLKNFTGYINDVKLISKANTSAGLTSVQMKGSTEALPNHFSIDLSEKLTQNVSTVGRYNLVPIGTKFTDLKHLGFLFEGGTGVSLIELEAEVEVWLV